MPAVPSRPRNASRAMPAMNLLTVAGAIRSLRALEASMATQTTQTDPTELALLEAYARGYNDADSQCVDEHGPGCVLESNGSRPGQPPTAPASLLASLLRRARHVNAIDPATELLFDAMCAADPNICLDVLQLGQRVAWTAGWRAGRRSMSRAKKV
jgi:hypothetical protein